MGSVNVFTLLLRVTFSLGIVLGLLWLAARFLGQGGLTRGLRAKGAPIEVVARYSISRRASIALVRTAGKGLVLGVTDAQVTVLAETDPDDLVVTPDAAGTQPPASRLGGSASSAWKAVIDGLRDKTARRTIS